MSAKACVRDGHAWRRDPSADQLICDCGEKVTGQEIKCQRRLVLEAMNAALEQSGTVLSKETELAIGAHFALLARNGWNAGLRGERPERS